MGYKPSTFSRRFDGKPCSEADLGIKMDLGVGSFVFALGLTSAPSLLKRIGTNQKPASILSSIKKTWIILLLGFIRLAMVKGTEYPVRWSLSVYSY